MSMTASSPMPARAISVAAGSAGGGGGLLDHPDVFANRHNGPSEADVSAMLEVLGFASLDAMTEAVVPDSIRSETPLQVGRAMSEVEALAKLRGYAETNQVWRSCIGMGYHGTVTPAVILRNVLENPGWYTQYTPYQAEISQGRLEALLNIQTMVCDLTGFELANASLLDEATAAAEAMGMCLAKSGGAKKGKTRFVVASDCHPQTIAVLQTRAEPIGVTVDVFGVDEMELGADVFGVLVQYPATDGVVRDYRGLIGEAHEAGAMVVVAADLLALTLLVPPGELGADVAIGSAQRLGVPMGAGGPHAAYFATHTKHARGVPGRIIGVSRDAHGNRALRMAIQTREQHIKRERATSNICTAQALLAIMASMYGVYHGPNGLRRIAERVRAMTLVLREVIADAGHEVLTDGEVFDTLRVRPAAADVLSKATLAKINLREFGDGTLGVTLDETVDRAALAEIAACFGIEHLDADAVLAEVDVDVSAGLARTSGFMEHPVFNSHHSETEMLRYMMTLQQRDLSLAHAMIPLGSCTMKLNATSEMLPVTWPEFANIHPFAPADQQRGYAAMYEDLERWLADITGFAAVSLQPNAGSQGEYTGLLALRAYHADRGEAGRDVCLIPTSAHGTNPASAVMAGMRVVGVACDDAGNIDVDDLRAKAEKHSAELAALMVTYPSTHGVFERPIKEICALIHEHGGQVYMDGANLNAQVGLCRPGELGADVCHLNLHKTFCIPHGGGGPGMGPIGVAAHLAPFVPGHPVMRPHNASDRAIGAVAAAPYGSPSILPISWMYIAMMGTEGLTRATQIAILNANYMAKRLDGAYDVLYRGPAGHVAHEFIVDCRPFQKVGVTIDDIAKRLMDFGFHGPTMSWPVTGTLMIEPTESEPKAALDRFCEAMVQIRAEIDTVAAGEIAADESPLHFAPHTVEAVSGTEWDRAYTRERAAFALGWVREHKFWPSVGRIDNPFGDRNLVCTCPPMEELVE